MSLREYHRKRDFRKTPEPKGRTHRDHERRTFVIQKHAASHLHYDFRLELDGVLKSWAVPKGPSLDPAVRVLAMQVEDHPLEYGGFEGIIPEGEYGGGTVMLWDRGTWEPEGNPQRDYRRGRLRFRLSGEKLSGTWTLARMKEERGRAQWLLIKGNDETAAPGDRYGVTERETRSVATDRTLEEIAADADRVWTRTGEKAGKRRRTHATTAKTRSSARGATKSVKSSKKLRSADPLDRSLKAIPGAKQGPMPTLLAPQLATLADQAPTGDEWLHELKFDGYRILVRRTDDEIRLLTRKGQTWTAKFSKLVEAAGELPFTGMLDGELVVLDERGVSDFRSLQRAIKENRQSKMVYYAFDLPFLAGYDLRRTPLVERKRILAELILGRWPENDGPIRYSEHIEGHGSQVLPNACRNALEGIVSKRAAAAYESGRTRSWLKTKCHGRQEFVIGGFTPTRSSRPGFRSLLLGYYRPDGHFVYGGRVGTGFDDKLLAKLGADLADLAIDKCPFYKPPADALRDRPVWVQPKRVAEVEFTEWTEDGVLRHPTFQGLREDKDAREVVREVTLRERLTRPKPNGTSSHDALHADASNGVASNGVASNGINANGAVSKGAPSKGHAKRGGRRSIGVNGRKTAEEYVAGVRLSHPDRLLYENPNLTKREIAEYYAALADWILPYIVDRPLTLVRCPAGQAGKCFFHKHWKATMPEGVGKISVSTKAGKEPYVTVADLAGLISLVQISVLEMHPWGARIDDLERPDQIVFDLDPGPDVAWNEVRRTAQDFRMLLDELELESFVRTSGGKGLHVVVPLARHADWDEVERFARDIAGGLARHAPDRFVDNMRKDLRQGKIFIDYLRNQRGSTSVASYSTRNRPGAPVAAPVAWDELKKIEGPAQFDVFNMPARLKRLKKDPWAGFFQTRQKITAPLLETAANFSGDTVIGRKTPREKSGRAKRR
jgi:bifunctional non-homologous end joining protein LigD